MFDASSVPIEIWIEIIQIATSVPDSLLQPRVPYRAYWTYWERGFDKSRSTRYEASLTIKRTVVQVCRQWNIIGTPLLYEHIVIPSSGHIDSLLPIVGRPIPLPTASTPTANGATLGSLVRRVDFEIAQLGYTRREFPDPSAIPPLVLCRSLPNLAVLMFTSDHEIHTDFGLVSFSNVAPKLEYLYVAQGFYVSNLFSYLESSVPNLRVLHQPRIGTDQVFSYLARRVEETGKPLQFPKVEQIIWWSPWLCHEFYDKLPRETFPNLRQVSFVANELSTAELRAFLSVHGESIRSIVLPLPAQHPRRILATEWLPTLRVFCPNLESLSFATSDRDATPWPPVDGSNCLPNVTTLGMIRQTWNYGYGILPIPVTRWQQYFDDANAISEAYLPRLERIQLVDEDDWEDLQSGGGEAFDSYTDFLKLCRERGVDVVDDLDRCLNK